MQGKTINGYTLQRLLGKGGMAEVWYAENKIGKKAAVKVLLNKLCDDEGIKARFLTEAKVMVELDHPNIRQVYDYGDIDGRPAIVMEYLEGTDLKTMLKRGQRISEEQLEKWWNQLVDALGYTHAKNVVHRDIKPSNIFIDNKGDVKLLDFGIAKVADTSSGTQTGSTLGTRIYMSPEQVKDPKRVGTSSDVYSLAVSFVHLLTGKAPYDSTTSSDFDIQVSIVSKPLDLSPLPEGWRNFLGPYLAKDPAQRPALRHFGKVDPAASTTQNDDVEEGTIVESSNLKPVSSPITEPQTAQESKTPTPTHRAASNIQSSNAQEKPKGKKGLWIGLAVIAAVVALVVLLLKPKKEEISLDTQAFNACQTVQDYRSYISNYGRYAEHYAEANKFVDDYMADSSAKAQQQIAQKQAEAEAKAKEEAEMKAKQEAEQKAKELAEKKANISVTTTKNNQNVLYTGVENPIMIKGISPREVTITAEGATLTKTFSTTENSVGYYLVVKGDRKNVVVNVKSDGTVLCSKKMVVKEMKEFKPKPIIFNVSNGEVSKSALLVGGGVYLEAKDCNYDGVKFEVTSYTCEHRPAGFLPHETSVKGCKFDDEVKRMISGSSPGDEFVFKNIRVKGNDGKEFSISDQFVVKIK